MNRVRWKALPVFNERVYEVSNTGLIRSVRVKELKPEATNRDYLRVSLYQGKGKWKHESVHRLVAKTFLPNPDNLPHVNHKNGIQYDNRVENLEWCTAKENAQHAVDMGLYPIGKRNNKTKLTIREVKSIRDLYSKGVSGIELAKRYKMDKSTIYDLINYKTWRHIK